MLTYLALGDSYTIGEQIPIYESFPYQLVQLLRASKVEISAPEIIAKTGWTTDELIAGISEQELLFSYDYITLLIGVNNQYRGLSAEDFSIKFRELVYIAKGLCSKHTQLITLSIPDWGRTPFAEGKDRDKIGEDIDAFNHICREISADNGITFINLTESYRKDVSNPEFVAPDGLHPSGKEYAKWAGEIFRLLDE